MVIGPYNYQDVEEKTLRFWADRDIYAKAKKKKGKKFYFLDGPPYTSGKVHLGTAWNKSLKDAFLRYKRMQGFQVWDRAGYDMHGLPIEHATEKELKVHGKAAIEKFGVAKFIKACEKISLRNLKEMNKDFIRLGVWMDFENPYMTMNRSYIESEWWLIKKVHEKKRLYEGKRTMHWCSHCTTAIAKHELEYGNIRDTSIFVKLKVKGKKNEFLIIWTTTPWTIPFNLAVMVHPELDYVRVKIDKEVWVVAKALVGVFVQEILGKKVEIKEEFKGKKLEGVAYEHPFADKIDFPTEKKVHTVVLSSEYVDTTSGSGLVHCAPGCGQEDYEVGHKNGLPAFNLIDVHGTFTEGAFKGWQAKTDDKKFIEALDETGALVAKTSVEHDYPHCQRCHKPVVFRATKQWFFKVEDLKKKMIKMNKEVDWVPHAAFNAFDAWLNNLRDNSITKQRFWGCPVPIWKCSCGKYDVIGSAAELEEKAGKVPNDLHKPGIDKVSYKCSCGKEKKRIPDILDVWVDAGIASWACLDYPQDDSHFDHFPADFILEGKDQIRGWFNLLLITSMLAFDKHPYKAVAMHGYVNDAKGRKMSKSLGNYILPEEVINKYGADTFRYNFIANSQPGLDISYNDADVKVRSRHLHVLWNLHKYLIDICTTNNVNPLKADKDLDANLFGLEEKYIISRMHSTIAAATTAYDTFHIEQAPNLAEELFLDLSRTYVQLVRDKVAVGGAQEKEMVAYVIYTVFDTVLRLLSPTIPFICEEMYQNLKDEFGLKTESVHLLDWPKADKKKIDASVELAMDVSSSVVQAGLAAREKAQLSSRWPIKDIIVVTDKEDIVEAVEVMADVIKKQVNSKEIRLVPILVEVKQRIKPDAGKLGAAFGDQSPKIMKALAKEKADKILADFSTKGKFVLSVGKQKYDITRDHVVVEREYPKHLVEQEIKYGVVYIDTSREEALVKEGYAREIMRHVQSQRKKAGLEKTDKISVFLQVDEEMQEMLSGWEKAIKEKVGASALKVGVNSPAKEHDFVTEGKVKDSKFVIHLSKT